MGFNNMQCERSLPFVYWHTGFMQDNIFEVFQAFGNYRGLKEMQFIRPQCTKFSLEYVLVLHAFIDHVKLVMYSHRYRLVCLLQFPCFLHL